MGFEGPHFGEEQKGKDGLDVTPEEAQRILELEEQTHTVSDLTPEQREELKRTIRKYQERA